MRRPGTEACAAPGTPVQPAVFAKSELIRGGDQAQGGRVPESSAQGPFLFNELERNLQAAAAGGKYLGLALNGFSSADLHHEPNRL